MATIGEAIIKLVYDGKSAKASLTATKKDAESQLNEMQKNIAKKGAKIATLATAGAVTAITGLATKSVKAFAEFEQISGGIQKIFNDMDYSTIEKDANKAWKSMNISASEYMKQISGVGAIFAQTMGDKKGYEAAKTGMQAIADYASGTGASVDVLMDKFQMISRATTSYQSIADQFAGILPQTTKDFLKQAQSAGFLSTKYKKLTDVPVAEYQEAISKMLQKGVGDMGLLGNTSEETEKTISGSFNAMKASWENVVTNFVNGGDNLDEALDALMKNIENLASNVIPKFFQAFSNIYKNIFERHPVITSFATALGGIAVATTAIVTAVKAWKAAVVAWTAVQKVANLVMANSPIFIAIAVIGAVIGAIVLLVTHIEEVKSILGVVGAKFSQIGSKIAKVVQNVWNKVTDFFSNAWKKVTEFFVKIGQKIAEFATSVWNTFFAPIVNFAKNVVIVIVAIFANLAELLWNNVLAPIIARIVGFFEMTKSIATGIVEWLNANIFQPIITFVQQLVGAIVQKFTDAMNNIKYALGVIFDWINTTIVQPVSELFAKLWSGVVAGFEKAKGAIKVVIDAIAGFFSGLWNGVKLGIKALAETIKNIMESIGNMIKAPINAIIDSINNVIDSINSLTVPDWVPGLGGKHANFGHIPRLAKGGVATDSTLANIGEAGDEAVIPLERDVERWAVPMAKALAEQFGEQSSGSGITVYMTNNINNNLDADEIGRRLMTSIRRAV